MNSPVFRKSSLRLCGFTGFIDSNFSAASGIITREEEFSSDQPLLRKFLTDNSYRHA